MEALYSLEVLVVRATDKSTAASTKFSGPSPATTPRAVALRLLDFPLLVVRHPSAAATKRDAGDSAARGGVDFTNVEFNCGKCCLFKAAADETEALLKEAPLYVMYLDVQRPSRPKLLATGILPLHVYYSQAQPPPADGTVDPSDTEGFIRTSVPLYSPMGNARGVVSLCVRLCCYGRRLLPHIEQLTWASAATAVVAPPTHPQATTVAAPASAVDGIVERATTDAATVRHGARKVVDNLTTNDDDGDKVPSSTAIAPPMPNAHPRRRRQPPMLVYVNDPTAAHDRPAVGEAQRERSEDHNSSELVSKRPPLKAVPGWRNSSSNIDGHPQPAARVRPALGDVTVSSLQRANGDQSQYRELHQAAPRSAMSPQQVASTGATEDVLEGAAPPNTNDGDFATPHRRLFQTDRPRPGSAVATFKGQKYNESRHRNNDSPPWSPGGTPLRQRGRGRGRGGRSAAAAASGRSSLSPPHQQRAASTLRPPRGGRGRGRGRGRPASAGPRLSRTPGVWSPDEVDIPRARRGAPPTPFTPGGAAPSVAWSSPSTVRHDPRTPSPHRLRVDFADTTPRTPATVPHDLRTPSTRARGDYPDDFEEYYDEEATMSGAIHQHHRSSTWSPVVGVSSPDRPPWTPQTTAGVDRHRMMTAPGGFHLFGGERGGFRDGVPWASATAPLPVMVMTPSGFVRPIGTTTAAFSDSIVDATMPMTSPNTRRNSSHFNVEPSPSINPASNPVLPAQHPSSALTPSSPPVAAAAASSPVAVELTAAQRGELGYLTDLVRSGGLVPALVRELAALYRLQAVGEQSAELKADIDMLLGVARGGYGDRGRESMGAGASDRAVVAEAGAAAAAESLTTIVSQLRERLLAERSTARPSGASQPAVVSGSSKPHITAVPMTSTRTADVNTTMRSPRPPSVDNEEYSEDGFESVAGSSSHGGQQSSAPAPKATNSGGGGGGLASKGRRGSGVSFSAEHSILSAKGGDSGSVASASKISSIFKPLEHSNSDELPNELANLAGFVMGGSDSSSSGSRSSTRSSIDTRGSNDNDKDGDEEEEEKEAADEAQLSAAFLDQSGDVDESYYGGDTAAASEARLDHRPPPTELSTAAAEASVVSSELDFGKQHNMHGADSKRSPPAVSQSIAASSVLESIIEDEELGESFTGRGGGGGSSTGDDATIAVESFAQSSFASSDSLLSELSAGSDVSEDSVSGSATSSAYSSDPGSSHSFSAAPVPTAPARGFYRSQSIPTEAYRTMSSDYASPSEGRRPGAPVVSAVRRSGGSIVRF